MIIFPQTTRSGAEQGARSQYLLRANVLRAVRGLLNPAVDRL